MLYGIIGISQCYLRSCDQRPCGVWVQRLISAAVESKRQVHRSPMSWRDTWRRTEMARRVTSAPVAGLAGGCGRERSSQRVISLLSFISISTSASLVREWSLIDSAFTPDWQEVWAATLYNHERSQFRSLWRHVAGQLLIRTLLLGG